MSNPVKHLALLRSIKNRDDISSTEYTVLMTLCLYADENGERAWPGENALSMDCKLSIRTIRKTLHSLQGKGFISSGGRNQRRVEWSIDVAKFLNPEELAKLANRKPRPAPPPAPDAQNGHAPTANGNGSKPDEEGIVYVNGKPHQPYKPKGLPPGLPPVRYRTAEETQEEKWRRTQEQIRRYHEREAQKGNHQHDH